MVASQDHSFVDRVQQARQALGVSLSVLVWGPGRQAPHEWYEKRLSIVRAVRDANPRYEVLTSEDIFNEDPPENRYNFKLEDAQLELIHAKQAHLIIALIVGPPQKQGGVYRELDIISQYRELRDKTWIFVPSQRPYLKRFQSGALRNFRESHVVPCTPSVLSQCESIRKACVDKANEEFNQLMLDQLHASIRR